MRKRRCFADKDLEELTIADPERFQSLPTIHSPQSTNEQAQQAAQQRVSPPHSAASDPSVSYMDTLNRLASFYAQFLTSATSDQQRVNSALLFSALVAAQMNNSHATSFNFMQAQQQASATSSFSPTHSSLSSPRSPANSKIPLKKRELVLDDEVARGGGPTTSENATSGADSKRTASRLTNFSVEALLSPVK